MHKISYAYNYYQVNHNLFYSSFYIQDYGQKATGANATF